MAIGRAAPAADELAPLPPAVLVTLTTADDALCSMEEAIDEAEARVEEADDIAEVATLEVDSDAADVVDKDEPLAPVATETEV